MFSRTLSIVIAVLLIAAVFHAPIPTESSNSPDSNQTILTPSHSVSVDPTVDSDNDGFTDAVEMDEPNLDPHRKDIIINVVAMEGLYIPPRIYDSVYTSFLRSPLDNGNGIRIHFLQYGDMRYTETTSIDDMNRHYLRTFSADEQEHQYTLYVVNDIKDTSYDPEGATHIEHQYMAVDHEPNAVEVYLTHEIGHLFGLTPSHHQAIDSFDVPYSVYPSVMNYNYFSAPSRKIQFYNGSDINEWAIMNTTLNEKHSRYNATVPDGLDRSLRNT